jgi:hypothetical protein
LRTDRLGYVTRIGPGNSIVTDTLAILWAYDPNIFSVTYTNRDMSLHNPSHALQTFRELVGDDLFVSVDRPCTSVKSLLEGC